MLKKWIRRVLIVVVLVAAVAVLRWTVFRPEPIPVTVYRVSSGPVEQAVTNSKAGTVKSRRRASLSPEIGGLVVELPVRAGDRVRAGQTVLRLSDADYQAQIVVRGRSLEAATASRHEACTAAEQAKHDLERYQRLSGDGIVSEELLDQFRNKRETAVAACDTAAARTAESEAALQVARVNLGKTVLRAPFAGVVTEVSAELGEWITPSPPGMPIPPVVEVLDDGAIYVSAPLDEVDVARVEAGPEVRITLDAYPGQSFAGRVTRVAPYVLDVEEQNRTFEVEVEFDDPTFAATLRPGTSADVEIILDRVEGALRVPSYALIEGERVLVLRDETLVSVPVRTGLANWAFTEITDGLEVGDRVVVSLDRAEVEEGAYAHASAETDR